MTDELKIAMIDAERDVLNMDIELDGLEHLNDLYQPREQERKAIRATIDGVDIVIDKDNCNRTVLEVFEDIVFQRQVEKITKYLKGKYSDGLLSHHEAEHELQDKIDYRQVFEVEDIALVMASDIVSKR